MTFPPPHLHDKALVRGPAEAGEVGLDKASLAAHLQTRSWQ